MTPMIRPLRASILTKLAGLAVAALLVAGYLAHAAAAPEPTWAAKAAVTSE